MFPLKLVIASLLFATSVAETNEIGNGIEIFEEYLYQEESSVGAKSRLRRNLQQQPPLTVNRQCSPVQAQRQSTWLCGFPGGTCPPEIQSCSDLPQYDCACTSRGNTLTTTCSFCSVPTLFGTVCQSTGSRISFQDESNRLTSCSCDDTGNGQLRQVCHHPGSTEAPFSYPTAPRAPVDSSAGPVASPVPMPVSSTNPVVVNPSPVAPMTGTVPSPAASPVAPSVTLPPVAVPAPNPALPPVRSPSTASLTARPVARPSSLPGDLPSDAGASQNRVTAPTKFSLFDLP